jgi:primosomal protein N' (replication factor Y)
VPHEIDVVLPAPWWTALTYECNRIVPEGIRVSVPLGRARRTGFSCGASTSEYEISARSRLREIISVLDEVPALPGDLWKLIHWLGGNLLYGVGHVLKTACPSALLKGQKADLPMVFAKTRNNGSRSFCYFPRETTRFETYVEAIEQMDGGGLVLFPERGSLSAFFASLPERVKSFSCIWPVGGGEKLWQEWLSVRRGEKRLVLGTSGAVFSPVVDLSLVIVEEEADPGHQIPPLPRISARTIAAQRASISGSAMILGGTSPSSRVFMTSGASCPETPRSRLFFVRPPVPQDSSGPLLQNSQEIPISRKLVDETFRCLKGGRHALWLLDRKGYAGELRCTECGRTVTCRKCGGRPRWHFEAANGDCQSCGEINAWPEVCPSCRSRLLEIRNPGLESTCRRAQELFGSNATVSLLPEYAKLGKRARNSIFARGGESVSIFIGTRALISLCRTLDVGLVGWLDADIESWKPDFGAKAEGYRIVWSSCWIGNNADTRKIVIQSRKPKTGWQIALEAGFSYFWTRELSERRNLGLPPTCFLLEISLKGEFLPKIKSALEGEGFEVLSGPPGNESLQVKVNGFEKIRRVLAPVFAVNFNRQEYPRLSLDFE